MPEDASLDDFLDSGDESADDGAADEDELDDEAQVEADQTPDQADGEQEGDEADEEPTTAEDDDASVTPATTTYAWSDEGATCEECGAPAERRWQQDGALVCPDCKVW